MLTEKTNETGEGQETQSATPSGDPTPANPENPTQENQGQGTTPTSNESENNNQNGTPTNADPTDNILTADEQARKQELEQSSLKELNDKKAEMGREQKKWDTERQSLLDRIGVLEKAVNTNDSDNSQSSNPTEPETKPDPHFQPTQPWQNEDGSINWDAAPQYLLRFAQQQGASIEDLQKQVNDGLASIRNEVIGIQSESKAAAEAQEWKDKFGIPDENFQTFKNLLDTKGQLAAFEYLSLTKKEVDGQRAALELQEQQRGNLPILNAGTPPANVKEHENNIEALAKQIAEMPFGEERTNAAFDISERVDPLTASAVLTRAAELTRAAFNAA